MGLSKESIFPLYMRSKPITQENIPLFRANKSVKPNQALIVYNESKEFFMRPKLLYTLIVLSLVIIVLAPLHS